MKPKTIIDKKRAKESVIEFCEKHHYSINKFNSLSSQEVMGILYYLHSTDVVPDGLKNDLATVPYPVLIVDSDYNVSPTQYTEKYLR